MQIILKTKQEPRVYIDWDVNYNCNYRCSYCKTYETGWNNTSFEKAIVAVDNLYGSVLNKSSLPKTIWFSGGEPSILPWFKDLCMYIKGIDPNTYLAMTTNGSQPVKLYSELLQNYWLDYISFSLHFEFAKPSHFLNKIYNLVDKHGLQRLSVIVMHEKQSSEQASEILTSLTDASIKCSTHLIRDDTYKNDLKSESFVFEKYESNIKDVDINGTHYNSSYILDLMHYNNHSFKGWKCWAGVDHFYITKDFDLLASSCKIKSFGNLLTDDISYDESPVICDGRSCICTANIKIKKEYTK